MLRDFIGTISGTYSIRRYSHTSVSLLFSTLSGAEDGFDATLLSIPSIDGNGALFPIAFLFPGSHSYTLNPFIWFAEEDLINW